MYHMSANLKGSVVYMNGWSTEHCDVFKSSVCGNVNDVLTESFEVERGVKQGCSPSAALLSLALSPLIKSITADNRIAGTCVGYVHKATTIA